jgi:hypothetical protein
MRLSLFLLLLSIGARAQNAPLAGAIYWGMWDSYGFGAPAQLEVTLSPSEFRDRIPFFGREAKERSVSFYVPPGETRKSANAQLRINADKQWIIDREIQYAEYAGINYFAYVYYGKHHYSHRLFKSSKVRKNLKMAFILSALNEDEYAEALLEMQQPYYQKVTGNRPLLYYIRDEEDCNLAAKKVENIKNTYKSLHPTAPLPYIVVMRNTDPSAHQCNNTNYADAFSTYTSQNGGSIRDHSYKYIQKREIEGWNHGNFQTQKRVPWVSLGYDRRPRVTFPVSWEMTPEGNQDPGNSINWAETVPNALVSTQITKAREFVQAQAQTCEAQTFLIYAWNEHDEGGWFCPTLVPGTNEIDLSRLNAVKKALTAQDCNLKAPSLSSGPILKVQKNENFTLTASCPEGTPVWNTGHQGNILSATALKNTTYQVTCRKEGCESNEKFVDIQIEGGCTTKDFHGELFSILPKNAPKPVFNARVDGKPIQLQGQVLQGSAVGMLSGTELIYDLGEDHGHGFLSGIVGVDDHSPCKDSKIRFYLRDWSSMDFLYISPELNQGVDSFKIDIRNIRYLRMDVHGENTTCVYANWANLALECPPDCEKDVPPTLSSSQNTITEGQSLTISATCPSGQVFWSDGSNSSTLNVSPVRSTSYTARCKTFGCDGSPLATPLPIQVNVNCDIPNYLEEVKPVTHPKKIRRNENILGGKIQLLDSAGHTVNYEKGWSVLGPVDIHFDLDKKREFHYFKVTVGFDPSSTCQAPVKFRIMNMVEMEDLFTTPWIYAPGKGYPNSYDMEVPVAWMQWFNLQIIREDSTDSCGVFHWANARYECYSDLKEPVLGTEEPSFTLYPNPSQGSFTISPTPPPGSVLIITDIQGRIIRTGDASTNQEALPPGQYIIHLKGSKLRRKLLVLP